MICGICDHQIIEEPFKKVYGEPAHLGCDIDDAVWLRVCNNQACMYWRCHHRGDCVV